MQKEKKGQSILEYVIVLTVIVGAVILGAAVFAGKDKDKGVGKVMSKSGGTIEKAAREIGGIKAE